MGDDLIISLKDIDLTQTDLLIRMLVATGIGFSIGLEREYSTREDQVRQIAGIRTFIFIVLLGFLCALMALIWGPWIFVAGFLGVVTFVGISYWVSSNKGEMGGTTEFTTLIAYLIGGSLLLGYIEISLAITVIVLTLLSLKLPLRNLIGQANREEVYAVIQFIVVLLLIFPFLPDRTVGPYDVFNPRELGWVVVIISGIGLAGYLLTRIFGMEKGILVTGFVGGIVSSTMVSWIYSRKSREFPQYSNECSVAILVASSLMVVRVFIWVWLFNASMVRTMFVPFLIVVLAGLAVALFYFKNAKDHKEISETPKQGHPLDWRQSLLFAGFYTAIMFLVSYAGDEYGSKGVYISSGIAALTDVDAIAISVSKLAGRTLDMATAENAILLVALSNTIVKWGISLWNGSPALRRQVSIGYLVMVLAGVGGFVILRG